MRILILKLIYPFWYFLAKTWVGNFLTASIVFFILPLIVYFILPESLSVEALQSISQGTVVFSLILTVYILFELNELSTKLEDYYWEADHKINKHD